ncbi:MAG: peptidase A26 [Fibrobacter sp.]|nr:peptidase A26 [Fibrobacter sp.]
MSKRLFAFIALFVFVQISFAAWDGSQKIPKTVKQNDTLFYEITSAEELVGYLESVLAEEDIYKVHAYLKNDIVFGADTSKLCEKVLDHQKQKAYFQSSFDGRGHTIYGLNAVNPLFNTIGQGDGYVINLNIANSSFGGDTVMYAASVARENLGVIRNVNVINTQVRGKYYVGGIAACMYQQSSDPAYIVNSNMIGGSVKGIGYVGGIVANARGTVQNCTNSASVTLQNQDADANKYIGGIAGYIVYKTGIAINQCHNRGEVKSLATGLSLYVGGVGGFVDGAVLNSSNEGSVTSKLIAPTEGVDKYSSIFYSVGGIVGDLHGTSEIYECHNLFNKGDIFAGIEADAVKGTAKVAGVLGNASSIELFNALNKGKVEAVTSGRALEVSTGGVVGYGAANPYLSGYSQLKNRGNVSAEGDYWIHVGGVMGFTESSGSSDKELVSQSFNYGNVSGEFVNAEYSRNLEVGGVIGYNSSTTISDVYNRGNVVAKGDGISYVGGIVGHQYYVTSKIKNGYSAASKLEGRYVGGVVGKLRSAWAPSNAYYDASLVSVLACGDSVDAKIDSAEPASLTKVKKTTAELQNDDIVALLNSRNGSVADRKIWTRRGGYPILSMDSLSKNDFTYRDDEGSLLPHYQRINDSLFYLVYTADELRGLLEAPSNYRDFHVKLMNDIVLGKDSLHLSTKKKTRTDQGCLQTMFNGNGHTIYGMDRDMAMFYCIDNGVVINLTIANSRFENDEGLPAAAIAIKSYAGSVVNVKVRNSVVHGSESVGGLVAYNGIVSNTEVSMGIYNSSNDNTWVKGDDGYAGGLAGYSTGYVVNSMNSGRVEGRVAGGFVGYADFCAECPHFMGHNANAGMVLATGDSNVFAGGIVGLDLKNNLSDVSSTGYVEAKAKSGMAAAGGIVGVATVTSVTSARNWGQVHVMSGEHSYTGGLVGFLASDFAGTNGSSSDGSRLGNSLLAESYNYGPVYIDSSVTEAYAGGLVGATDGAIIQDIYNRGSVFNVSKNGSRRITGGLVGQVGSYEKTIVSHGYNMVAELEGSDVGAVVGHIENGYYVVRRVWYESGLNADPVASYPDPKDTLSVITDNVVRTFEEMKSAEALEEFAQNEALWQSKGCLPVFSSDTTTACSIEGIAVSFAEAESSYKIVYLEKDWTGLIFEETDGENGNGGEHDGPTQVQEIVNPLPQLSVEIRGRELSVAGLLENKPVMVLDMHGRLVKSVRFHGASVNLSVPKAGIYIVRNGNVFRKVSVR